MNWQQIKTLGGWRWYSSIESRPGQQNCAVGPIIFLLFHTPLLGGFSLSPYIVSELLQTLFTININEKMWRTYVVVALSARHVHIYLCCLTLHVLYCIVRWRNVQNMVANTMSKIRYMGAGSSQWERVREQNYINESGKFPMGEG